MNFTLLAESIRVAFDSLWGMKVRGSTLEVITPFSTPNNRFISVFITFRDESWIITDGGWMNSGEYISSDCVNSKNFLSVSNYFEGYYSLKKTSHYKNIFYYKAVQESEMVPNGVYDLAQFISHTLASFSSIYRVDQIEEKEIENFQTEVTHYISGIVGKDAFKTTHILDVEMESVRFNGILETGGRLRLLKYVTGSDVNYYRRSLTNASADFEIADRSKYKGVIDKRIAVLNDNAKGFDTKKMAPYIELLQTTTKQSIVRWSQKTELEQLLHL